MAKRKVFSIGASLSDGLEQTISAAHNYSSNLRIDVVPLKNIEFDPDNPRALSITIDDIKNGLSKNDLEYEKKSIELKTLTSLASSIQEQGIINPILVYEKNGLYRIIAGERRTLASFIAKKYDIQVKILDGKPDELKIRLLQWVENIERSDLSLTERLDNLEKIVSAFAIEKKILFKDIKITDISHLIGCTKSHAMSIKAVLNADDKLKHLIATDKIRNLEKAALIANIQSITIKNKAITECIKGTTLKKLRIYLEQDRSKAVLSEKYNIHQKDYQEINFGFTKNSEVARIVLESLIGNSSISNITNKFKQINLDNPYSIAQVLNSLVRKLEKVYG